MGGGGGGVLGQIGRVAGTVTGAMSPAGLAGGLVGGAVGGGLGDVAGNMLGNIGDGAGIDTSGLEGLQRLGAQYAQQTNAQLTGLQPQQTQYGQQLADQALGKAPSIAEAQIKATTDRNIAQQFAANQANRSVNPALAQRQFQQSAAQQGQMAAQAGGIQRMQEQQANQQQFGNYLNNLAGAQASSIGAATGAGQAAVGAQNQANANRNNFLGSILGAAGSVIGMNQGGTVPANGPRSVIGQHFMNMQNGGNVPGQANVSGDSPKNDTVPTMLSPGEIVIPRSVLQGKKPAEAAAKFVAAALAKRGK